jgi:putative methionine-R-sulfoxide reductase with GAF domain/GGDEF domain-containing protein
MQGSVSGVGASRKATRIAILGGGEEELNILSEFHRTPGVAVIGVYDRDPHAVALEIAEIIGIPHFSDETFLPVFVAADYIVVTEKRKRFEQELVLLGAERKRIVNPAEAASRFAPSGDGEERGRPESWPAHLEEALQYMNRITDRERLLKWLLEMAVRAVSASSGSIMLFSPETRELYIGYATGLSAEVIERTRQKLGDGIAGAVGQTREARLIHEVVDAPLYREGRERDDIQSAISAPIAHQGRLVGVMNVSTNTGERRLGERELQTVSAIAERIAPILNQHLLIDAHVVRELEFQIRQYIESLFRNQTGFHERFTLLCQFIARKLSADNAAIYTATDEGDWLILGGSDQQIPLEAQSPRIRCNRGSLARAFIDGEEIVMTEAVVDAGLRLKTGEGVITSIFVPLVHHEPLGVLVLEFSSLAAFQTFLRLKDALRFQVGFFAQSLIREARQTRKLESLEELASLAPAFLALEDISVKIERLPALLSTLVRASMGSVHYEGPGRRESSYYRFPEDDAERRRRIEYDVEMLEMVRARGEAACLSYLSPDVDFIEKPPPSRSVIGYPIHRSPEATVIFIGYDKTPTSPLDSSIFGEHELMLLRKAEELVSPLFLRADENRAEGETISFDELLRYNKRLMLERIREEIERAERYHHGFVLTVFRVNGLAALFEGDPQSALKLINELSMGVRRQVRKTDFFSWMETDLFAVLSIERHQRMAYLEDRIRSFIVSAVTEKGSHDPAAFLPANGYALYPGGSTTAMELFQEAIARMQTES